MVTDVHTDPPPHLPPALHTGLEGAFIIVVLRLGTARVEDLRCRVDPCLDFAGRSGRTLETKNNVNFSYHYTSLSKTLQEARF